MKLPDHKTKIVCTIGPASESPAIMKQMIEAGMNVARLNFSHGDFAAHKKVIENLRAASASPGAASRSWPISRARRCGSGRSIRSPSS